MKAYVYVSLKKSVLDPQGKTIQTALSKMGYKGLEDVRQGKYFEISLNGGTSREQAESEVERIAREVLTNPVIEEFRYTLEEYVRLNPLDGTYGIGHTRWATHGRPTEENAHPHRDCTGKVVVVHNGIIENYIVLKRKLAEEGHRFSTETDTEVIAHLVEKYFLKGANGHHPSLEEAVRKAVGQLTGVFALAVIAVDEPNKIVAARNGPPAVIGLGKDEYFVASDVPAILYHTRDLFFLADGDLAVITPEGVCLSDFNGQPIVRQVQHVTWDPIMAEKGGFKHFMLKEVYEQPRAVRDTTLGRISQETGQIFLDEMEISEAEFKAAKKVNIAAC